MGFSLFLSPVLLKDPHGAVNPSDGHLGKILRGVGCDVYEVRPTPHSAAIKPLQAPVPLLKNTVSEVEGET
jgi:hypothetical protein